MILSVPITACIKICLQSLDHPIPRFLAGVFEGHIDAFANHDSDEDGSPMLFNRGPRGAMKGVVEMAVLDHDVGEDGGMDLEAGSCVQDTLLPIPLGSSSKGPDDVM